MKSSYLVGSISAPRSLVGRYAEAFAPALGRDCHELRIPIHSWLIRADTKQIHRMRGDPDIVVHFSYPLDPECRNIDACASLEHLQQLSESALISLEMAYRFRRSALAARRDPEYFSAECELQLVQAELAIRLPRAA